MDSSLDSLIEETVALSKRVLVPYLVDVKSARKFGAKLYERAKPDPQIYFFYGSLTFSLACASLPIYPSGIRPLTASVSAPTSNRLHSKS